MKKHNENDGGARDLDALLQKLKAINERSWYEKMGSVFLFN